MPLHPLDANYQQLKCQLTLLKKNEKEYQIIQKYVDATKGHAVNNVIDVWRVDREEEVTFFRSFSYFCEFITVSQYR